MSNYFKEKSNPWVTNKITNVYDTPWISVYHHDVLNPAGKESIYGCVHFKNNAVGVIALNENQEILLVGQYRYPVQHYSWEIPEGGSPIELTPLESAKRELLEETGYTAKKWKLILEMDLSNSATDEKSYTYLAEELSAGEANPDEDEDLEMQWVPFQLFYDAVKNGEIRDAITVAACYKVADMMHNEEF